MAKERPKPIDDFAPGLSGVIIDPSPLMDGVPTNALVTAQNATHDPLAGRGGALRKRPGFAKFNQANAGAAILGGIPMSVLGTGGAPSGGGGGDTGGGDGGGDGGGGGGGDVPPVGGGGGGGGGTGSGGGGNGIGGGAFGITGPGIVISCANNDGNMGHGWYLCSDRIAAAATIGTIPYLPGGPRSTGFDVSHGRPYGQTDDHWLYFQLGNRAETVATTATIIRTNGTTTQVVGTIAAFDTGSNKYPVVTAMAYAPGTKKMYVAVRDTLYNVTTGPAPHSRIIEIDHTTLVMRTVTVIAGYTVFAMLWEETDNLNTLYFGTCDKYTQIEGATQTFYAWQPGYGYSDTAATHSTTAGSWGFAFARGIISTGDGVLWLGALRGSDGGSVGTRPLVYIRLSAGVATGVLLASTASGGDLDTHFAETPSAYCGVYSVAPFNTDVYATWYNAGVSSAIVRCVRADPTQPWLVTSAVDVWNDGGVSNKRVPLELYTFNGVMYAVGSTGSGGNSLAMYSLDGITWVNITSNLIANNPTQGFPFGIFWGIDAA